MNAISKKKHKNLQNKLNFINISNKNHSLFEWKINGLTTSYVLDLNVIRKNRINDVFFHIERSNMKIVYIRKNNMIYTISTMNELQYQILEAILEKIIERFNEIYDLEVIFSFGDVSSNYFKSFKDIIEEFLQNFYNSNLIKKIDIYCKVCEKLLPLYIKTSIIENSNNFPVPIVYRHHGHSIICFIDRNYILRGTRSVIITG